VLKLFRRTECSWVLVCVVGVWCGLIWDFVCWRSREDVMVFGGVHGREKVGEFVAHQNRLVGWTRGGKRSGFDRIIDL
jgi:hypothetical protein